MDKKSVKDKDNFFQSGLRLATMLSGWLIGPIIGALFLGRFLDAKYQTAPWLFLACLGVAFLITSFGIVREAFAFIRTIEQEQIKK